MVCVRSFVPKEKNSRVVRELIGAESGRRKLDHRPDLVRRGLCLEALPHFLFDVDQAPDVLPFDLLPVDDELQLVLVHDDGNHDLGRHAHPFLLQGVDGLEDRADLHFVDLGIRDRDAAAAVAEHRD